MDRTTLQPMLLSVSHIRLVKQSWRVLRLVDSRILGDLFYAKLFHDHPEARPLFPKDMELQYQKLIDTINVVVGRLDHLEDIADDIKTLGVKHIQYGALRHHYDWVGDALLWTLKTGMQQDWTPEVEQAWSNCYQVLAQMMMEP